MGSSKAAVVKQAELRGGKVVTTSNLNPGGVADVAWHVGGQWQCPARLLPVLLLLVTRRHMRR